MKRISIIGIIVALLASVGLRAQEARIKVSSKSQVAVGEQFKIAFEANAEGRNFTAPSFNGFTVVGGPFNSSSSSVQIINGSMSRTVSHTYSYVLRAEKEGSFTIGEASLVVDGETIKSEPFPITVTAASDDSYNGSQGQTGASSSAGTARANTTDPTVSGKDLFFTVVPSKKSVYVGEPVVLTYKLYTRVPVSQLTVSKMPSYGGFWMKEVGDNSSTLRQTSETVNGIEYTAAEVKKVVLVPQKTGTLTIEPMGLECIAQIQTQRNAQRSNDPFDIFFNDPFFNRSITNVQKNVETALLNLTVKNLPAEGRPDSFAGAVGNYNFSTSIDRDEVSSNEAVTMTVTVSGSGNIELLNLPTPAFPPDFEVYDPKIVSNIDATGQGMSGTKKAEILAIPRRAGDFVVPPMEFSYFNPAKGQYVTLRSSQHAIHVEKGANDDSGGGVYASNQEGIKHLGSDIRHIMTGSTRLKPLNTVFFGSLGYFLILAFLLLLFVVTLVLVKHRRQFRQDTVLVRNRQATKVAKGRLKNAYSYLKANDQNHFYEELSQALWGYISDKLGIERSVLSMDTVKEAMVEKGIGEPLPDRFVETLNACEFARFAPGDAAAKMKDLYDQGMDLIMKVEKAI